MPPSFFIFHCTMPPWGAPAKTIIAGVETEPFINIGVTTSAAVDTLKAEVGAARRLDAAEIAMGSGRVAVLGAM